MYLNGDEMRDEMKEIKMYVLVMSFHCLTFPFVYCHLHFISIHLFHFLPLPCICYHFHTVCSTFRFPHSSSFHVLNHLFLVFPKVSSKSKTHCFAQPHSDLLLIINTIRFRILNNMSIMFIILMISVVLFILRRKHFR